ncbi:protein phosphatase 2C domain-containing protein [Iningainema sp. BLCCT55]|uniref:Protein phosphatase 2C domain-containing protein n=2 Tax=Iningainema TaxID=1932705 RepID=A0A8J7BZD7_9CYAN|nr:protein phosphatase 2C domain-containing protein [Iningainema tapete]MBD2777407.1 protein phosphatase 2C domain-containing protein [Iningainema tapete BLCC-T55]
MQCSKCGTKVQVGDRFCEECGTPLNVISSTGGCEKCGAPLEEIDADGFCFRCGFRQENLQDDRFEVVPCVNLAGVSDRGLRHQRNEDYVACACIDRNTYVLVVCDGVSSSQSPELAAKAAAETACRALTNAVEPPNPPNIGGQASQQNAMKVAIAEAMTSVCAIEYTSITGTEPPSTTIVAAVVVDSTATIGWLGDSRAYWISPHCVQQLTKDDSWLNDVVSVGEMSEVEARKSPHAHAITRWLGADAENSEPSIVNFQIPGSGHLLLCTDGLWNYTPELLQLEAIVNGDKDAVAVARRLVQFALSSGGHDNISVAILSLGVC